MDKEYTPKQFTKKLPTSNIETIDAALFKYIDETLNLHCTTAEGFKKVPVIWANSERAYQIKNNISIRDENGSLIPPIISINRKNISKDLSKKGIFQSNLAPGHNRIYYTEELNQDKTSNFANADSLRKQSQLNFITSKNNKKKVYKYRSVLIPVYVTIDYEIQVLTNYFQQMNEITQPFMTKTAALNYFVITHESFRYECFIQQDFSQEVEALGEEEKKHKSTINIKVLGQLVGDGVNQDIPTELVEENPVEIKFPRESQLIISEEKPIQKPLKDSSGVYLFSTTSGGVTKKTFLIGDGINSIYTITHDMNSRDMYVNVRESSGNYEMVYAGVSFINTNSLVLNFGAPIGVDSHVVVVIS